MTWFAVLLYLWAAGISGALALIPSETLGRRFFRFHAGLLLVLVTVATIAGRPLFDGFPGATLRLLAEAIAWVLVADILVIASLSFSRPRPVASIAFLIPLVTGAFFATTTALARAEGGAAAMMAAHLMTSGALLGSVVVAMNLGHAYLRNAALSFDHLVRLAKLFLGAAIAKTLVSLVLLVPRAGEWGSKMGTEFDWMLVLVRVAGGLGFCIVFGFMALSCARSRANQSATGILYAAIVFVIVGEAVSMYLTLGRGIAV